MLYLNFAAKNEELLKKLTGKLETAWLNDPLNSPKIIFADKKIEQWFRLKWIKKKGILANLESVALETFLWQSMVNKQNQHQLTADVLQNVIHAALVEPVKDSAGNDIPYYKTLEGLTNYLGDNPAAKLSAISTKIATLFLEYETSRPSNFFNSSDKKEGILDAWNESVRKPYFSKDPQKEDPIELWQRTLYSKIFHKGENGEESFFSKAARNAAPGTPTYQTLSYLYGQMTTTMKKKLWEGPVYIFGLAGCGQFYRQILQDMSNYIDIHVYVQNPCAEFWEDVKPLSERRNYLRHFNQNQAKDLQLECREKEDGTEDGLFCNENNLLQLWGKAGRDNIKLWCEAANYDFNYWLSDDDKTSGSVLSQLQNLILTRQSRLENKIDNDDSLMLFSAPTTTREVENLKEQIFKDMEQDPSLRLDEMIVLVPKLDDYRIAIQRVFDNVDPNSGDYIPYTIADAPEQESLSGAAIQTLMQMARTGEINRASLFELLQNAVIEDSLEINDSIVNKWKNWVIQLNMYRETIHEEPSTPHEFSHGIRRLLLNHLMECRFETESEIHHPYGNIDSADDKSLEKFCDIIERLETFIKEKNSEDNIALVLDTLNYFLNPRNFKNEVDVIKNVHKELYFASWQNYAGRTTIPFDELEGIIARGINGVREGSGKFLVSGLNFTALKPTRAFSMKVVYILGMNAKDFPGRSDMSTLDLRVTTPLRNSRWPGDSDSIARNRYAFLCTLMDTKDKLRISYLGKNLKKDEELFPSSMVEELKAFLKESVINGCLEAKKIDLDEKRNVNDIYSTLRLRKYKIDKIEFKSFEQEQPLTNTLRPLEIPQELSINVLKDFANNPFEFQIRQTLKLEEYNENVNADFEPIAMNGLLKSNLDRDLFKEKIKNNSSVIENNDLIRLSSETGVFPKGIFAKSCECNLETTLNIQEEFVNTHLSSITEGKEYSFKLQISDSKGNKYADTLLRGTPAWEGLYQNENGNQTPAIFTLCNNTLHANNLLNLYLLALLKTLSQNRDSEITLLGISGTGNHEKKNVHITVNTANVTLSKLIKMAFIDRYANNWPSGILKSKINSKDDYNKEIENLMKNSIPETKLFSANDFSIPDGDNFKTELNSWKELFAPVFQEA